MNPATSLYLDTIRALAALVVFFHHGGLGFFSKDQRWLPSSGHEMVVVFFVLSGFVIAYTAERTRDSWRTFAADRLSRLWSVAIPALVLTLVLDTIGHRLNPAFYQSQAAMDHTSLRYGFAATFLNQSWSLASKPGSNGPFWSLAYEFWYYALFAGLFYARGIVAKIVAVVVFVALTGYKIAILLPVWLLGVIVFRLCRSRRIDARIGCCLAVAGGILSFVWAFGVFRIPGLPTNWQAHAPLFFSSRFVPDLLLGLAVSIHIVGLDAALRTLPGLRREHWLQKSVRFASGRSFSLYVFHMPILVFLAATVPYDPASPRAVAGLLALTLAAVLGISELTEQRRDPWRKALRRLFRVPEKARPT